MSDVPAGPLDCRRCVHWIDRPLAQVRVGQSELFFGCEIHGQVHNYAALPACPDYLQSPELFAICGDCGQRVPKVCVTMGQCINCLNTDLWCVENCAGIGELSYCSHRVRLQLFGHSLIQDQVVFELYPVSPPAPKPDDEQ
jgi:hypothetical protein